MNENKGQEAGQTVSDKLKKRGQVSIEYILLLGAIIVIIALTTVVLHDVFFKQQTPGMQNKSDTIKVLSKQLSTVGTPTPRPTVPTSSPGNTPA